MRKLFEFCSIPVTVLHISGKGNRHQYYWGNIRTTIIHIIGFVAWAIRTKVISKVTTEQSPNFKWLPNIAVDFILSSRTWRVIRVMSGVISRQTSRAVQKLKPRMYDVLDTSSLWDFPSSPGIWSSGSRRSRGLSPLENMATSTNTLKSRLAL